MALLVFCTTRLIFMDVSMLPKLPNKLSHITNFFQPRIGKFHLSVGSVCHPKHANLQAGHAAKHVQQIHSIVPHPPKWESVKSKPVHKQCQEVMVRLEIVPSTMQHGIGIDVPLMHPWNVCVQWQIVLQDALVITQGGQCHRTCQQG
jgi:hypothetical protein